ncbi:hypothetical protein FKM82_028342 [Ascaphus truei]
MEEETQGTGEVLVLSGESNVQTQSSKSQQQSNVITEKREAELEKRRRRQEIAGRQTSLIAKCPNPMQRLNVPREERLRVLSTWKLRLIASYMRGLQQESVRRQTQVHCKQQRRQKQWKETLINFLLTQRPLL